jgi:hypothetical protein
MSDARRRLSQAQVAAKVAEIREFAAKGDHEAAHSREDELYRMLLEDFASQGFRVASLALETQLIKFSRHCA